MRQAEASLAIEGLEISERGNELIYRFWNGEQASFSGRTVGRAEQEDGAAQGAEAARSGATEPEGA
ncbi:hypothetical protein D3C85_1619820 [compost metagenome]